MKKGFKAVVVYLIVLLAVTTFSMSASANSKFKDVDNSHWAYNNILKMTELGVINGYEDNTFRPNNPVTRAQSAMFLTRSLKLDTKNAPKPPFKDVNQKTSGYESIALLTDMGVFSKAEKFNPSDSLSRGQMAKILVKSFNLKPSTNGPKFNDTVNHWANSDIQTLAAYGITSGKTPTTFGPNESVTRAQLVSFISRTLDKIKDDPSITKENVVQPPTTGDTEEPSVPPTTGDTEEPSTPPTTGDVETPLWITSLGSKYQPIEIEYYEGNPEFANVFLAKLNEYRISLGLPTFTIDQTVQYSANFRSKDMADNNDYNHYSKTYGDPLNVFFHFTKDSQMFNEVIYSSYYIDNEFTSQDTLEAFQNSPGHNAALISPNFNVIGVGFAIDKRGYALITVQFSTIY